MFLRLQNIKNFYAGIGGPGIYPIFGKKTGSGCKGPKYPKSAANVDADTVQLIQVNTNMNHSIYLHLAGFDPWCTRPAKACKS